jgi:hypothetical protein
MLTVALKELRDAIRDTRSLVSSVFYCLMGPGVVWMVSQAVNGSGANTVLAGRSRCSAWWRHFRPE